MCILNALFGKKERGADLTASVSAESNRKKEKNDMENEKMETKQVEKEVKATEEETPKTEKEVKTETETKKEEEVEQPVVERAEEPEKPNALRIEDVATKDFVSELIGGLSAKIDALVKENADLKDKLAESDGKVAEMHEKYEKSDFGSFKQKGVPTGNKVSYETFEEYSKQFM